MITTTATGKEEEFDNQIARTSQSGANDFETGATEDLRAFIKALRKHFGKNAVFSVHTNGNLDHGGGLIQLTVNISNYPDAPAEQLSADSNVAAYDRKNEDNLVSNEEMDARRKEREEALAKGQVTKDDKGNQIAGLKPAIAEIKH